MNDHVYDLLKWSVLSGGNGGNSGGGGGGESGEVSAADMLRSVIDRSITEFSDSTVTKVGDYTFSGCAALANANLPNAKSLGHYAFRNTLLVNASFPKVETSGGSVFDGCKELESADFPIATIVSGMMFYSCSKLKSANFPNALTVGNSAFYQCSALESVNIPKVTSVGSGSFTSCSNLKTLDLPEVTSADRQCFYMCQKLTTVNVPKLTSLKGDAFYWCGNLTVLDFPAVTRMESRALYNCSKLQTLILRSETLCTLASSDVFQGSCFLNSNSYTYFGGRLVVPRVLTTEYANETNWSVVLAGYSTNRVLALEDFTVDGTITGAIDWDKLNAA